MGIKRKLRELKSETKLVKILRPWLFGCPKNALSSETKKFKLTTTFSHYLGQKHCRKSNFENFCTVFNPAQAVQSFST